MKRTIKEVWFYLWTFLQGLEIGFVWWDQIVFEGKLPKVLVLGIIIAILPFNLIFVLVGVIMGQWKIFRKAAHDIIIDVELIQRSKE